MGCTSGQPSVTTMVEPGVTASTSGQPSVTTMVEPGVTASSDDSLEVHMPKTLRMLQERRQLPQTSMLTSSTLDSLASASRSPSNNSTDSLRTAVGKLFVGSHETTHRESMEDLEDPWPELLLGKKEERRPSMSMAKQSARSPIGRGSNTGTNALSSACAHQTEDKWLERLCGQRDETPLEWTKSTLWVSKKSRETSKSFVSTMASTQPQLRRLNSLTKDELRDITFEILSGMLIALAASGNALSGIGALPSDASGALIRCQQELERYQKNALNFILALADLVILFSDSLIDAGVAKKEMARIDQYLHRSHQQEIPDRIPINLCETDDEFSKLVKNAKNTFSAQMWDEFGFSAGQMVWHLVKDL